MKNISSIAQDLATKNSHVRESTRTLMEKWEKISACEETIIAQSVTVYSKVGYEDDMLQFHLHAGKKEIMAWNAALEEYVELDKDSFFWTALTMPALRDFLFNFSKMVKEIKEKMEKNLISNEELLKMLDKINN